MTDHENAVRACISQMRKMAEELLTRAAMLENIIDRERKQLEGEHPA